MNESSEGGFLPFAREESIRSRNNNEHDGDGVDWAGPGFLGAGGTRPGTTKRAIGDGPLESLASFWLTAAFLFTMIQGNPAAQKQRRVWKIVGDPGSDTVNSCARPIRLIRTVAMTRLFLGTF